MAGIPRCLNDKCIKKDICYRFKCDAYSNTSEATYQNICKEDNGYQYFYEMKTALENTEKEAINN